MNTFMRKLGVLAATLSTFLSASAYDFEVDGIYYNITDPTAKEVEVTYQKKHNPTPEYNGDIMVPSSVSYDDVQYSVTAIGEIAFWNCSNLTSISLPNSVTTIIHGAFERCSSLTSVNVDADNQIYSSNDGILYDKSQTSLICCPEGKTGGVIIPNTVTAICELAFCMCGLTSISLPNSVTTIGYGAFYFCGNLTSITIPSSVTTIGYGAFDVCLSLTGIYVDPDNPAYSSNDGILYDKSQTSLICCPGGKAGEVIISNSVTTIEDLAFSICTNLTSIMSLAVTPPECGDDVFDEVDMQKCTLYVPAGCKEAYQQAPQWKNFIFIEELDAVSVAEIRLNETEVSMKNGSTFQLTAEVLPTAATNKALQWKSSNISCVTVDENGLLTAIASGTATITVRSADGNAEASCAVTVSPTTGIDSVAIDDSAEVEVFNLTGTKVADTLENLPAGIYLVREGSTVQKITVR